MSLARLLCVAGIFAVFALGCSDSKDDTVSSDSQETVIPDAPEAGTVAASERDAKGVLITKVEYGADWPYTVDSGALYCDPPGSNVVMESDGKVYALNGRAMGNATERGYLNARETITLRDEYGYFTVGDAGKIISRGLAMCN